MTSYDLYHDPGHGRLRHLLPTHPEVAELVKTAEFEDCLEQVPETAFAWPSEKRFPVHTPEHAALSYLYAKTAEHKIPKHVLYELDTALNLYGIDKAVFEPVQVKEAELSEDECLLPETQAYPVRNADEVKLAEQHLLPQVAKLHPETRARMFHKLAQRALFHGVNLQPTSYKYAGLVQSSRKRLIEGLRAREAATKEASCKEAFSQLALQVRKEKWPIEKGTLIKMAEAIGTLDERAGLFGQYDKRLPDPITTVFNTEKIAYGDEIDIGGTMVRPQALGSLDSSFYSDLLGKDIVRDIAPHGGVDAHLASQILPTLPSEERRLVGRALMHAGVGYSA